jgi:DNA-binding winged helix-turn-helix (wHTH) protein
MSADKELLISAQVTDAMKSYGCEFSLEARPGSSMCWRITPQRNLLQLCQQGNILLSRLLEPRLMQLLCLLTNANGKVLTRETLMQALWPRVIVNENSLTRAISELRKAFVQPADSDMPHTGECPDSSDVSDDIAKTRLIETVPKRGYRLNARLITEAAKAAETKAPKTKTPEPEVRAPKWSTLIEQPPRSFLRHANLHIPAIAAAVVISAALSSLWTLKLSNVENLGQDSAIALVAQASTDVTASAAAAQRLVDRVLNSAPTTLPEGLHWLESVHNKADNRLGFQQNWLSVDASSRISNTVLAPGGQMLAFVEEAAGRSELKLRSLITPADAWTVFTSSSTIMHLQWSPLGAGLLFTLEDGEGVASMAISDALDDKMPSSARLARLMLLDLETLQVRELHRRIVPATDEHLSTVGRLS